MKTLDFTNQSKGMEMSPDYSKFVQEGAHERFKAILDALTRSSTDIVVLKGCKWTVDGASYDLTEGEVYYQGKIRSVPAFSGISASGSVPVWSTESIYAGNKAYHGDGLFYDVFGYDNMKLQMGAAGSGIANWDQISYLDKVDVKQESWRYVGEVGQPIFKNGWSNLGITTPLRFMKDTLGFVHVEGEIYNPSAGSILSIFTLPVGYRPDTVYVYTSTFSANVGIARFSIGSNGEINPFYYLGGDAGRIQFSFSFKAK